MWNYQLYILFGGDGSIESQVVELNIFCWMVKQKTEEVWTISKTMNGVTEWTGFRKHWISYSMSNDVTFLVTLIE